MREPPFNGMSPLSILNQEKPLTLLRGHPQLANWNSHDQRCIGTSKKEVNQLVETQTQQQETLVHVISILNVTRYAMQVYR